jgi:hypothetical protein
VVDSGNSTERLIALTAYALRETIGDLERLQSVPIRDDAQFGDRPKPAVTRLEAWLYSSTQRIAFAVHTPDWASDSPAAVDGWQALLREHLHGDFHAGHGWTPVNAVAMPVRKPFDEPGLRVVPLLSLWAPVSQQADAYFSETMTASVREGRPHVVGVRVFSAAVYLREAATGARALNLTLPDRRPVDF